MSKDKNFQRVLMVFEKKHKRPPLEVFETPYEILISTLLSARTNDDTTLPVSKRFFKKVGNFKKLSKLSESEIAKLIYPVGFYKTKAKHLKKLSEIILRDFGGSVPATREELMSLPGVGRKTANLVLNRAFGKPAIAVDTHVHRISNLLGWVNTKKPEETEKELMKVVPEKYWKDINRLFVGVGRQFRSEKRLREFLKEERLLDL